MARTAAESIAALNDVSSIEELRQLISEIDIVSDGSPTVFFTGTDADGLPHGHTAQGLAEQADHLRVIQHTEIAQFLDLDMNPTLRRKLQEIVGGDPSVSESKAFRFLNGDIGPDGERIPNGIWDEVSARFARETVGKVRVLASLDRPNGVFALSELPALLDNANVTEIDGIPRTELAHLARKTGYSAVAEAIALNSQVQMTLSGLSAGDTSAHLAFDTDDIGQALKDPVKREAVTALLNDADPQARAVVQSAVATLLEGAEVSRLNGVSRALNRMGYVGGVLSFLLASAEASAAPSEAEAEGILKAWAVEALGGEAGAIIGAAVAGIAAAAVGVASAPVSAALVLGASMVGGFFGAAWAPEFYRGLGDKDRAERARVLGRLTELYFGEGAVGPADSPPAADGSFRWIDPDMSADAIYQAAKTDLGWRYALAKLNPFVVTDVDYAAIHGANGELDLFADGAGEGMTDEYLRARSEALHAYSQLFHAGRDLDQGAFDGAHGMHFFDAELQGPASSTGAAVGLDADSEGVQQRLFGSDRGDLIRGGTQADRLFGGRGDDHLAGGTGADYLEGGVGYDTYLAGAGDRLFDVDGSGRVLFDDSLLTGGTRIGNSTVYASDDGALRYERAGDDLQVTRVDDGARLTLRGYAPGALGILLQEPSSTLTGYLNTVGGAESELLRGQIDAGVADKALLNAWNLPDHISGLAGRDWIYAWDDGPQAIENGVVVNSAPDTDVVEGGPGKDFIHGGAGADRLYATDIQDAASVMAGTGTLDATITGGEAGDFVSGQSGADTLYGSALLDGLFGGDGDDLIYGGAGDDIIDGDRSSVISPLSLDSSSYDYDWFSVGVDGELQFHLFGYRAGEGSDRIYAGDGDDLVWGGAADDYLYGGAGNDRLSGDFSGADGDGGALVPGVHHGHDFISGGAGDDAINGNGGDDVLLGGSGDDALDGDFRVLIADDPDYLGSDYLDGGTGQDVLSGNGGADWLLGGAGDDLLFGDMAGLAPVLHGADVLYGGDGEDHLVGHGGNDRLYGGNQADRIYGDDVDAFELGGDDWLYGGLGADELSGGLGDDRLHGGDDADRLWGDAGNDQLSGGRGLDYLAGGSGADTYRFAAGDGPRVAGQIETLVDGQGQGNAIAFASDVMGHSIQLALAGDSGDLVLSYGEGDGLYIVGGLTGAISEFAFGDSTPVAYQDFVVAHLDNARFLQGGPGNDLAFGSAAGDVLQGDTGDDTLIGGAGADTLDGGTGINRLVGGEGADTYLIAGNAQTTGHVFAQNTIIDSADRSSVVRFGPGIEANDLRFQDSGSMILISSSFNVLMISNGAGGQVVDRFEFDSGAVYDFNGLAGLLGASPNAIEGSELADELHGTPGRDALSGGAGDDLLYGSAGGDRLDGGGGADRMWGGAGYDTYLVDQPGDRVIESADAGFDWVLASIDYRLPDHVEALQLGGAAPLAGSGNDQANYIAGNAAANRLSGGPGNDRIHGRGGLDVLDGGAGDDLLEGDYRISGGPGNDRLLARAGSGDGDRPGYELSGGSGDDVYEVWQPYQMYELGSIYEGVDEGQDTLVLYGDGFSVWPGLPANVENLRYEYSGDLWYGVDSLMLRGNALDNRIEIGRANPGAATALHGLAGDDTLIGSAQDESGNDSRGLFGGDGNDLLKGLAGNDNLFGGPGDDVLEGGPGSDRLRGGMGADTYVFARGDSSTAEGMSVIEDADGGSVIRFGPGIGARDIRIEYVGQDMHLAYTLDDVLIVRDAEPGGQIARYDFASGAAFSQAQMDRLLAGNAAPVTNGPLPAFRVFEGRPEQLGLADGQFSDPDGDPLRYSASLEGAGQLPGWIHLDSFTGTFKIDAPDGHAGDYLLRVSAIDPHGEAVSAPVSLQILDTNFIQHAAVDEAVRGSVRPDNLYGTDAGDRLYGYAGEDWLIAGGGDDRLYGGAADDLLLGGSGADSLNGQAGGDRMVGEAGDDRYFVDSVADTLVEGPDGGLDRVHADIDFALGDHFEDLVLRGEQDLVGTGNAAANRLFGNAGDNALHGMSGDDRLMGRAGNDRLFGGDGDDLLNGQTGDDRMVGGAGDDRYFVDSAGDEVLEEQGAGFDRVFSDIDFALSDNLECLTLRGPLALAGIGNAEANRLYGNPADNALHGGGGDDRLYGRDGRDHLSGDAGNDVLAGGHGNDHLAGGLGSDRLFGHAGDDTLAGGAGDDLLDGGLGSDEYRFGTGDGSDRIRNAVDAHAPGDVDRLVFTDGVDAQDIWFSRAGNDLLAQLVRSEDQVRVRGWFSDPSARIDHMSTTAGEHIAADQLDRLVHALAAFNVENAARLELSPKEQADYAGIVAAHWQPATAAVA